jgi:hypothetical protein
MIPDEEAPFPVASVGHNSGDMRARALAELREQLQLVMREGKTFEARKAEFLASAARQNVRDRQSAADAADVIRLASEVWTLILTERVTLSTPYRETHLALKRVADEFWAPVAGAMEVLNDQIDAWTAEEDKRIADQQAEQEAEMARLREAANKPAPIVESENPAPAGRAYVDYTAPAVPAPRVAPPVMRPAKRATIVGDLGGMITQATVTDYVIEDISLIPAHIMQSETVVAAILSVVKSTAKHFGTPPGIRKIETSANRVKK